jgi:MFS family permease
MFTSLTILPIYLAKPPYNLSEGIIGVTFLPVGITMLVGAVLGGAASDISGAKFSSAADGRQVFTIPMCWLCPLGTIAFGFCLDQGRPLYAVLLAQALLGLGQAALMPSTMNFLSFVRQDNAGSAGAVLMFLCFGLSAVSISVSIQAAEALGVGYFFLILAGFGMAGLLYSSIACAYRLTRKGPTAASVPTADVDVENR